MLGMCLLIDVSLKGFPARLIHKSIYPGSLSRCSMFTTRGNMSDILLFDRYRYKSGSVNLANAEMSDILLFDRYRYNSSGSVNPANADMSDMRLFNRSNESKLVACSSPVKSLIFMPPALNELPPQSRHFRHGDGGTGGFV